MKYAVHKPFCCTRRWGEYCGIDMSSVPLRQKLNGETETTQFHNMEEQLDEAIDT